MTNRSLCCLPTVTLLFGLLCLSIGFNVIFIEQINRSSPTDGAINSPVNDDELKKTMEEVKRLSKQTYVK